MNPKNRLGYRPGKNQRAHCERLVEELRSGRFVPFQHGLRPAPEKEKSFKKPRRCCLGVACDVLIEMDGKGKWDDGSDGFSYFRFGNNSDESYMPGKAASLFGLDYFMTPDQWEQHIPPSERQNVSVRSGEVQKMLALFNDARWSFKKIANWVEHWVLEPVA